MTLVTRLGPEVYSLQAGSEGRWLRVEFRDMVCSCRRTCAAFAGQSLVVGDAVGHRWRAESER